MNDYLVAPALRYIALGLRVMALTGKTPNTAVHKHWKEDSFALFSNAAEVVAAFTHRDTTGIGIAIEYPYVVVDIDGPLGAQAWFDIVGQDDYIPSRWVAQTGRGLHLWFSDVTPWPNAKLGEKLDFKAPGGYVAAPPSQHFDDAGKPDHVYTWLVPPEDAPLELPAGLQRVLTRRAAEAEAKMEDRAGREVNRGKFIASDGTVYKTHSFEGIFKRVAAEAEGNRNHVLYWATMTLLDEGADEEEFEHLLALTTLTRREAKRTMRSAFNKHE